MADKFTLKVYKPLIKSAKSSEFLRVSPADHAWVMRMCALTGLSAAKIVSKMVKYCDENLQIVEEEQ